MTYNLNGCDSSVKKLIILLNIYIIKLYNNAVNYTCISLLSSFRMVNSLKKSLI